ncbi:MAG: sodium ion-translocating decarboxylase subunit beta, partial [Bacteroidales bacterium]
MKKTVGLLSFIVLLITLFSGWAFSQEQLESELTSGKWMNRFPGHKVSEESEETRKRFKGIQFNEDRTCYLDSTKMRFSGTWEITDDKRVIVSFHDESLGHREGYLTEDGKLIFGGQQFNHYSGPIAGLLNFYEYTGFGNVTPGHLIMLAVGLFFIFLAIRFEYEPLLLIPIGVGIIIGNIPFFQAEGFNLQLGLYEEGSVLNYLYLG